MILNIDKNFTNFFTSFDADLIDKKIMVWSDQHINLFIENNFYEIKLRLMTSKKDLQSSLYRIVWSKMPPNTACKITQDFYTPDEVGFKISFMEPENLDHTEYGFFVLAYRVQKQKYLSLCDKTLEIKDLN
jgi:hypothetical protein